MTATETREALTQAYDDVVAGLRAGDLEVLRARVSEDCRIVGPKGFLIGRAEWIASHDGSVFQQISLETVESGCSTTDRRPSGWTCRSRSACSTGSGSPGPSAS